MKIVVANLAVIGSLFILGGCAGGIDEGIPAGVVTLPSERIVNPETSGIADAQRRVLRSNAEWQAYWAVIHGNRTPRPSLPPVNFNDEMLIVASMGRQPTGGYSISIDEVYQSPAGIVAVVTETSPAPNCQVTQVVTAPVDVVRIPASNQNVRFIERDRVRSC